METTKRYRPFTTFEVAKICGVFHTTVINWVNKGRLKAHCTPGGHRRILLPDLLEFMKKFEMPIPADLAERPKRVLVVEDNVSFQRVLIRSLQTLPGIEVQACSGGLEALIAMGKEAPDVAILDIRIPEVDGLAVCRVLKSSEHTKPVKIIAISGETLSNEDEKFLKRHADCLFYKPFSTTDLKIKVMELMEAEASIRL